MMDESTQLNHWIALMAELEEAKEKIAKAVYEHYKAGRVANEHVLESCRRLDDMYKDASDYEAHLQKEFQGYTQNESIKSAKLAEAAKAKATSFFSKLYIRHTVNSYKRNFRDQYLDLATRVLSAAEDGRVVCAAPQVVELIKYCARVKKEADMRWEEICILQREQAHGSAFLTTLKQFFTQFSSFARQKGAPWMKKFFNSNDKMVEQLRAQYRKSMASASPEKE